MRLLFLLHDPMQTQRSSLVASTYLLATILPPTSLPRSPQPINCTIRIPRLYQTWIPMLVGDRAPGTFSIIVRTTPFVSLSLPVQQTDQIRNPLLASPLENVSLHRPPHMPLRLYHPTSLFHRQRMVRVLVLPCLRRKTMGTMFSPAS
jgi:hypothetical protein